MSHQKNLLFISSHLPSMTVPQAGQKIAYAILKQYSENYNVYLISFFNEIEKAHLDRNKFEFCVDVHFFEITNKNRFVSVLSNLSLPVRIAARADKRVRALLLELMNKIDFETIHFEFTSAAFYLRYISSNIRTVLTEHDVMYQSLERKLHQTKIPLKVWYALEYLRQKKWELKAFSIVDEIIVLNDKDRRLLVHDGVPTAKIRIVHPDIDESFKSVRRNTIENHSILFWGAMNRSENIDAVKWFVNDIFPRILKEVNNAKLYVVGADPPREIVSLMSTNTIITGFVRDPLCYFERCQVAIAPLRMGAGIKIKVLEYLAAGLPVVATSVGAEGIADDNLILADGVEGFAGAIIQQFARVPVSQNSTTSLNQ